MGLFGADSFFVVWGQSPWESPSQILVTVAAAALAGWPKLLIVTFFNYSIKMNGYHRLKQHCNDVDNSLDMDEIVDIAPFLSSFLILYLQRWQNEPHFVILRRWEI